MSAADALPRRPRRPRRPRLVRRRVRRPHRGRPVPGRRPGRARRARGPRRDGLPRRRLSGTRSHRPRTTAGWRSPCTSPSPTSTTRRAGRAVGATVERPPTDASYGRTGVIVDPYGHRWMLQTPAHPAGPGPRPGDAVYLTLQVPDGARARDFYEAVLGWSSVPGRVPDGWQVEDTTPMIGIGGGTSEPGMVPMYAVDDIEVAVAAVRTAGGQAGEIETAALRPDHPVPGRPGAALLPGSAGLRRGRRPARHRGRRCRGSSPVRSSSTSSRSRRTCRRR